VRLDDYTLPAVEDYRWETNVIVELCSEDTSGLIKYVILTQEDDAGHTSVVALPLDDILAIADKYKAQH